MARSFLSVVFGGEPGEFRSAFGRADAARRLNALAGPAPAAGGTLAVRRADEDGADLRIERPGQNGPEIAARFAGAFRQDGGGTTLTGAFRVPIGLKVFLGIVAVGFVVMLAAIAFAGVVFVYSGDVGDDAAQVRMVFPIFPIVLIAIESGIFLMVRSIWRRQAPARAALADAIGGALARRTP